MKAEGLCHPASMTDKVPAKAWGEDFLSMTSKHHERLDADLAGLKNRGSIFDKE